MTSYVEFDDCAYCVSIFNKDGQSDLACNFCGNFCCPSHSGRCRLCDTFVCAESRCFKEGMCIGCVEEKEDDRNCWYHHFKKRYNGHLVHHENFENLAKLMEEGDRVDVDSVRIEAMRETLSVLIETDEVDVMGVGEDSSTDLMFGRCFPHDISKFIDTEEKKGDFVSLLEHFMTNGFLEFLLYSEDSAKMTDLLSNWLKENEVDFASLTYCEELERWIRLLKQKGLDKCLPVSQFRDPLWSKSIAIVDHYLENRTDIDTILQVVLAWNLNYDSYDIVEHLLKKGASLSMITTTTEKLGFKTYKVLEKYAGRDFILSLDPTLLLPQKDYVDNYLMIKWLSELKECPNITLNDKASEKICRVALFSFGLLKLDEMEERHRYEVIDFIRVNDVKINTYTLPFVSIHVKRRMRTFLLCLQRLGSLGRDLKMKLLNYIWSHKKLK